MTYPAVDFNALPAISRELHKENAVLGEVFRATLEAPDLASGVERAVEILRDFFGTASVGAYIVDGDHIQLLGVSISEGVPDGVAASIVNAFGRLPLEDDLPGTRAMRSGRVLRWGANDPSLDGPTREALDALGAGQLYAFPIILDEAPIGCAVIALPAGRDLGGNDQRIVGRALEHLARLQRMLRSANRPEWRQRTGHGGEREREARQRPLVLLAEGDAITAEVIQHRLEREGFDILHYGSGDAAASAFGEVEPDLCVVELKLPGMGGLELLQQIRGNMAVRRVPVVILTSVASEKMVARAFALGADDYVLKPFSLTELTARIWRRLSAGVAAP